MADDDRLDPLFDLAARRRAAAPAPDDERAHAATPHRGRIVGRSGESQLDQRGSRTSQPPSPSSRACSGRASHASANTCAPSATPASSRRTSPRPTAASASTTSHRDHLSFDVKQLGDDDCMVCATPSCVHSRDQAKSAWLSRKPANWRFHFISADVRSEPLGSGINWRATGAHQLERGRRFG